VLYSFCNQTNCLDGSTPAIGLTFDASGNLYGATTFGGAMNDGIVYKLTGTGVVPPGTVYVTNYGFDTVSVLEPSANAVAATIPVGFEPEEVAVIPDGQHAYVANSGDGTVSVIATATNKVTATIAVGSLPRAVAVSTDGTHAYVANGNSNTVSVIVTVPNKAVATVTVGLAPNWLNPGNWESDFTPLVR